MNKTILGVLALALLIGVAGVGFAKTSVVLAKSNDSSQIEPVVEDDANDADDKNEKPDMPITGPDLEKASATALKYLGEGRVTETEIEDEESYYEVEVKLNSGREIDVQLDENFNVVGTD